jgi:outer membrane receptor protein involved in Fe transport
LDLNAFKQSIDTDTAGFEEVFAGTKQSINGKFKHNESPNLPGEVELESFGASLNYTFDGWGTLTASISEMEFTGENIIDGLDSGPGALAFISNAVPGFTAVTTSRFGGDKLTSEIRFASDRLGNIEFMVGAYYTDEDLDSSRVLPIINPDGSSPTTFNPSFLNPMAPNVNLPFDGSVLTSNNPNTYEEEAVFANLTYYFTEEIDLTLGARSGSIEQEVNSVNTGLLAQATFNPGGLYQSDENVTNLSGVLRWRAAEDLSLYFKVAEGYRPGGPQIANPGLAPFEADEVTNYELGAKGALLDKSFTYSVSAYLMEWENTQLPGRDPLTRGIIIENGPDAEVMGVEAEFAYRPAANWLIAGNIGYNTSELIEVVDASIVISTNAEKGDPLPLTPEWAGSLDVSYNHNISNNIVGDYGVTIKSRGSANSGFPNNNGVTEIKTDTLEQVDLRAAFTFDDKYRLSLIAENVTNEAGIQSYKSGTVGYATRYRPRTIYVTAKMDF